MVAVEFAFWFAELEPELTSPPAIETGSVPVDRVLVALRSSDGELLRLGVLDPGLESARAAATGQTGRAADVLVQRLILMVLASLERQWSRSSSRSGSRSSSRS